MSRCEFCAEGKLVSGPYCEFCVDILYAGPRIGTEPKLDNRVGEEAIGGTISVSEIREGGMEE